MTPARRRWRPSCLRATRPRAMELSKTFPLEFPWARRQRYMRPCEAMVANSTYNLSYLNNPDDHRRDSFKMPDHGDLISMGMTNDGVSIYGASFEPTEEHVKPRSLEITKPEDNLRTGVGDVSNDTINRMSFRGWPGVAPPLSIAPPKSVLAYKGNMSSMTTSRHDYTAKDVAKPDVIVPEGEIKISNKPMEGDTTAGMSFQSPDLSRFEPAKSFQPKAKYNPTRAAFDGQTVSRMSYTGAKPDGPFIIASKNRPAPPPLSEEERSRICDPGLPPEGSKPSSRPARFNLAAIDNAPFTTPFEICRPKQETSHTIPHMKDLYSK